MGFCATAVCALCCTMALLFCIFALSAQSSVSLVPNIFLSLQRNTERISVKFAGGRPNHYHKQINWLHFGLNQNSNNGTGYERKFEATSIGLAATSNRC